MGLAATGLAATVGPPPADAETVGVFSSVPITSIGPEFGPGNPFPATLAPAGVGGVITDVDVTLRGLEHTNPDDIDILLVSPSGTGVVLMSDACGTDDLTGIMVKFDDDGSGPLPDAGPCASGSYQPHNSIGGADSFPGAPAGPYQSDLDAFDGQNPSGQWRLYVSDDADTGGGQIGGGWQIDLETGPAGIVAPDVGTEGKAAPYPFRITANQVLSTIDDADVLLRGIHHRNLADLDVLLVGPGGKPKVMLLSDACAGRDVEDQEYTVDGDGTWPLPTSSTDECDASTVHPTDWDPGESLPTPAPPGPYNTDLSAFDGRSSAGVWKLFVVDDAPGAGGFFADPPAFLVLELRPDTRITGHPRKRSTKRRARFVYRTWLRTEVGVECRIDSRPWQSCPLSGGGLDTGAIGSRSFRVGPGKHVFRVRGVYDDSSSVIKRDLTPSVFRWRVRR